MEYLNRGGLFVSTVRNNESSPDYFGSVKIDRQYLKFLMEQQDGDGIEVKFGGWKSESKTGTKYISLKVDTYSKKEESKPKVEEEKDEWEI